MCVISVREGWTKEDGDQVNHCDDWGWTLITRHKRRNVSSHRESTKWHVRENMVRRPNTKTFIMHSKKEKIKVQHYQELCRPITLGEYLPNWFYTKFTCDGTKVLRCNIDEKETKDATPSYQSSKDDPKPSPKVENTSCPSQKMFHICLLESKMHVWPKSHSLMKIFCLVTHFIITLY